MELKILTISDKGNLINERIGFKALKNCQLKYFIVFKTQRSTNGFGNISKDAYWFLPQNINENDKVVLYTRKGINSIIDNNDGTKTYFFYWGKENAIFIREDDVVVVISSNTWEIQG